MTLEVQLPGTIPLQTIVEQSPVSMEYYSKEGLWEFGNAESLKTFGIVTEEIRGFDLFTDEAIPKNLREDLRQGRSIHFEQEFDFAKVTYKTQRTDKALFDFMITVLHGEDEICGYLVTTLERKGRTSATRT